MATKERQDRQTFASYREAKALPTGELAMDYPHRTQAGLICRVHPNGKRVLWHRWKLKVPDGLGGFREDAGREELGELASKESQPGKLTVEEAVGAVNTKRARLRQAKKGGISTNRLTVKAAWALYPSEHRTHREATRDKDRSVYEKYYSWFEHKYLDELPYAFWNEMLAKLEKGTLVPNFSNDSSAGTLGPLRAATLFGVINVGISLYEIAHKHKGLQGFGKGENPAREAKAKLLTPNVRTGHIPLTKVASAWRAADQLVSPWWRDQLYTFILTGLRRNLVTEMQFSEIDWSDGSYIIPTYRAGTKRRRKKEGENPPPIRLPLSRRVLSILEARRRFAPDPDGPVWYSPRPTRGKATKKQAEQGRPAVLTDSRAAWSLITDHIGVRFSPQDLRRTFATIGAAAKTDVVGVSLLMLHSGQTLAKAAQIPGITVQYMQTELVQDKMRDSAEAVSAYVEKLLAMTDEQTAKLVDPRLQAELEEALGEEAEPTYEAGDEDSADYER